jgi:hypothetical protein
VLYHPNNQHQPKISKKRAATYVIWKHPGHLTSMKNEFGSGTIFLSLWVRAWTSAGRLRRSTAKACRESVLSLESGRRVQHHTSTPRGARQSMRLGHSLDGSQYRISNASFLPDQGRPPYFCLGAHNDRPYSPILLSIQSVQTESTSSPLYSSSRVHTVHHISCRDPPTHHIV